MSSKAIWGLTVLLTASTLIGCGQSRSVVRGQSPGVVDPASDMGPIVGSAPGYGEQTHQTKRAITHRDFKVYNGFRDNNFGYEGGYYAGQQGYYSDRDRIYTAHNAGAAAASRGGCPACEYGAACPQNGCPHCGCGNNCAPGGNCGPGGCPQNYQTYSYKWPQNQVYPPDQVPAGMVQYPYYTLRGPTDFFMK